MEHKEKQKIFAQTFVPSVERFHDNPSLIQLASKAKDSKLRDGDDIPLHRRLSNGKRSHINGTTVITETLKSTNVCDAVKLRADSSQRYFNKNIDSDCTQQHDLVNQKGSPNFINNSKDMRLTDSVSPRFLHDVKHGSQVSEVKQKFPLSKSISPAGDQRQITSISACTWTPGSAHLDVRDNKSFHESHSKDHNSCAEPQTRSDTLSMPEDKLDSKDVKQSSRFFRSFPAQSGRAPMKLERNRGNQKLPVGIAVARQRQHACPAKLKTTAAKNTSPELDRRYHEHALNQEREVLLRENKELSNYTSRLQTSTASSLPMLNLQSALLPGAWEREQAIMASSLLQWQQQQTLLSSGLQHPSMWFGGASPYAQTGSSLPTGPTPLVPGGFVIMPQFLQESAMASMWPQLALYGNSHPASRNISSTFQDLISQQLQNLQHHELQQAILQQGVSFPVRKSETTIADEHRQPSTFVPKRKTENARMSPYHRLSVSPKTARREATPNLTHDEHQLGSPLRSPPTRTPSFHQHKTSRILTPDCSKSHERNTTSGDGHRIELNQFQDRKMQNNNIKKQANLSNTQVLDLTSLPDARFNAKSQTEIKNDRNTAVYVKPTSPIFHVSTSVLNNGKIISDDNNNITITMKQPCNVATTPDMQKVEKSTISENATALHSADDEKYHAASVSSHDSSGVELLTKAADIHLKHMNANFDSRLTSKHDFRERDKTISVTSQNEAEIDITTIDPEVLDAVRGITLLSQSLSKNQRKSTEETVVCEMDHADHVQTNINDCNDDVQSTVSFSSITDSTIISGDCMSGSELKDHDIFERVKLRRKLKRPISSTLKYCKEEDSSTEVGIKLDSMEAKEVDMRSRLADLQRRYKEKQKELAKISRKNRNKHDSNTSTSSTAATPTTAHSNSSTLSRHHSPSPIKFKFPDTTALTSSLSHSSAKKPSVLKLPKSTVAEGMFSPKRKRSSDNEKEQIKTKHRVIAKQPFERDDTKSLFEKFQFEALTAEKPTTENQNTKVHSDDLESEVSSDHQQIPSGSRKRKTDKPKRICIPVGERPTVPLVEPAKKSISSLAHVIEERKSEKKKKRKMKQVSKKLKVEQNSANRNDSNMIYSSSWVFKSNNKSEKHEKKQKKSESEKKKVDKANKSQNANLSNNNNKRKKSRSVSKEVAETESQPELKVETVISGTPRLELREEDLVKGLQVLVPLEDKLLYLCQINPIQPPDIYEVTVEGERHRHRPNVMCLEQILKEAVPDVKPRSSRDLCEGSRVAAYWSHKMHCLYTGTISFDDSDDEGDYKDNENMVQVEFDDGDSSMIPLEDIRLLPTNYPIMQPDAPFMMHYINRRRTSEITTKEVSNKGNQSKSKKGGNQATDKKEKTEEKQRKKSEKTTKQKRSLDLSAYDYPSNDDAEHPLPMPRKRASPTKINRKSTASASKQTCNAEAEASSSAQSSSAEEEDSDTVFSDSSDDTYDGDDRGRGSISRVEEKRIPMKHHRNRSNTSNHSNELWTWYDDDSKKKEPVKGKARKIYHKSICRGGEIISCGDSAVFLSAGRPNLPYIGRIESMWESWGNNMVVKVRWFYHPEETKRGRLKSHGKHPLYKSSHIDENDVQTISHKCEVVSFKEYNRRMRNDEQNVFYCTGNYDPATCQVLQEHSEKRKHQKS